MVGTVYCGDIKMKYLKLGDGKKTLVIIPGLSVKETTSFEGAIKAQYKAFLDEYTIYLFDRRSNSETGYTIFDMADDTAKVLDVLGLKNICLYGVSQGGMISMLLAAKHPKLVTKLALVSTSCKVGKTAGEIVVKWREAAKKNDKKGLAALFAEYVYSERMREKHGAALVRAGGLYTDGEIERFVINSSVLENLDLSEYLKDIKCPAIVIGAEGDKIFSAAEQKELADKLCCESYMYGTEHAHSVYDEALDLTDRLYGFFES